MKFSKRAYRYRIKKKKSILRSHLFWFSIFFLSFLSAFIYFFLFSDFFKIKEIVIFGEKKVSKDEVKLFVESELKNKNIFLLNLEEIKKDILEKFPLIEEVKIKRKIPRILDLEILERKEVGVFCQNESCFLLDRKGIIFENAANENQFSIKSSILKEEPKLGEIVIERGLLSKILEIEKKLKENFEIFPKGVLIISEEELHFQTQDNWEIFINPQKDIDWQLTKLKEALEEAIPKEKVKNLEYIDLRFGNFAFPKYKE